MLAALRRNDFPLRQVLASAVAVTALAAAIIGALLGREDSGLALAIASASGGTTDVLQAVGDQLPFGYAFAVGMAAAVNPCGFALLPTYLGLFLGNSTGPGARLSAGPTGLGRAVLVSASMTTSFVGLFGAVGLAVTLASTLIGGALPWLSLAVGVVLLLIGGFMLGGGRLSVNGPERMAGRLGGAASNANLTGYAAYGLAFALSSLACALPLFLAVVGTALATGGLLGGLVEFVLYGLGMGAVVTTLTLGVALFGRALVAHVRGIGRLLEPLSAFLLLVTGAYVIFYWLSAGGLLS